MSEFKKLMSNLGFGFLAAESLNLHLLPLLEDALKKDGKSVLVSSDMTVSVNFDTPITSTEDLFRNEFMVARSLLESWCMSVTSKLIDEINMGVTESPVYISLGGSLYDAYLSFENVENYLDEVKSLSFEKVSKIHDSFLDWQKTVDFICGGSDLLDEVTKIKNDKFNDD